MDYCMQSYKCRLVCRKTKTSHPGNENSLQWTECAVPNVETRLLPSAPPLGFESEFWSAGSVSEGAIGLEEPLRATSASAPPGAPAAPGASCLGLTVWIERAELCPLPLPLPPGVGARGNGIWRVLVLMLMLPALPAPAESAAVDCVPLCE